MRDLICLAILASLLVACDTEPGNRERVHSVANATADTFSLAAHGNDTVLTFPDIAPSQSRAVERQWDIAGPELLGFFLSDSVLIITRGVVVRRYLPSDTGRNILARSHYAQTYSSDNRVEYTFTIAPDTVR